MGGSLIPDNVVSGLSQVYDSFRKNLIQTAEQKPAVSSPSGATRELLREAWPKFQQEVQNYFSQNSSSEQKEWAKELAIGYRSKFGSSVSDLSKTIQNIFANKSQGS